MLPELSETTTVEVAGGVLLVPLGSCEQHGPHLPLGTDTLVASAVARRAGVQLGAAVAPALPYGASGEHAGFAGTLSIGTEVLAAVVVELVRSADAFAGTVLVSGHGGNSAALRRATGALCAEGRRVLAWTPPAGAATHAGPRAADAHAGWVETSVVLALSPASVRLDRAVAGDRRALAELMPALLSGGVGSVSPNGVLGDPAGASAETGEAVLTAWVDDLVRSVQRWSG